MRITKTDFLEYLRCPNNFWLEKNDPKSFVPQEDTEFEKTKIQEGYEVEQLAQSLFTNGILVSGMIVEQNEKTKELIANKESPIYQATFLTGRSLLAKVDILTYNKSSDRWNIYEVKSSTKVKTDRQNNHIKDVAFQKIALEEAGISVGKVSLVLLNSDFKKDGDINVKELFQVVSVTEDVSNVLDITKSEINEAVSLSKENEIDRGSCSCIYLSRSNHCSSFSVFNPEVPDYSIHNISRIRPDKIKNMVDSGIVRIEDISDNIQLTNNQRLQVDLEISQRPLIDRESIRKSLRGLEYPLYFFDYETHTSAIPVVDGLSPHQHLPFQVSIHLLNPKDKLEHFEFLANQIHDVAAHLIEFLEKTISATGTIVSWHATFENSINSKLADSYPEHKDFLLELIRRTFDLEKTFKADYLHPGFRGRSSIKQVLPVLLPNLTYKNLDIQSGTEAMENWRKMIFDPISATEKKKIEKGLLEYCAMDTLAMVEIFKHLREIVECGD